MSRISARTQTTIATLVFICLIPFIRLGEGDLQNDEVIYASRAQEMVASGNEIYHVPPRILYDKQPPLILAIIAGTVRIFGFTSFSVRLISALSAVIIFLLLYWFTLLVLPPAYALGASALLASSPMMLRYAQLAQLDVPWLALIVAAFCVFWYSRELGKKNLYYWSAVLLGLSFDVKLFVSILPLGTLCVWIFIESRRDGEMKISLRNAVEYIAIVLIVALPWHIWAIAEFGKEFFTVAMQYNVIGHTLNDPLNPANQNGMLYYINQLSIGFPLVAIVVLFFVYRVQEAIRTRTSAYVSSIELFLWLWLLSPLFIISIMGLNVQSYTVQLLPPVAILALLGVQELSRAAIGGWWRALSLIGAIALCAWGWSQTVRNSARELFSTGSAHASMPTEPFIIAVAIVVFSSIVILIFAGRKNNLLKNIFLMIPAWGVGILVGMRVAVAATDSSVMRYTGASRIASMLPVNAPVALITEESSEDNARMQFHCYDKSKTLYQRLSILELHSFAQLPVMLPDSDHFAIIEQSDLYFGSDTSGKVAAVNLTKQQYVVILQTPKYELFARGLARE